LIYNGHGLQDQNDSAENTQRLWNDTRLQDFILSHPHYPELVAKQDRRAALEFEEISNLDRDITQLDKILRLRNLARLQSQFERHATEEERRVSAVTVLRGATFIMLKGEAGTISFPVFYPF
jgi:hypothetical protein